MFASLVPRVGGLLAQRAVQVAAAGLLTGVVAGTAIVGTGLGPFAAPRSAGTVEVLGCPASGPDIARISAGQTMLVTARSVDGHWLEVYIGEPGIALGWVPASALRLASAPDSLPIGACVGPASEPPVAAITTPSPSRSPGPSVVATVEPSASQGSTPTARPTPTPRAAPTARPTPRPTPTHTPKPTPAPTVDPNPPQLANMQSQYQCIGPGGSSQITVNVNDPDGDLTSVTIGVTPPGFPGPTLYTMTRNKVTGVWFYTILAAAGWPTGWIHYEVDAHDGDGNSASQSSTDAPWTSSTGNSLEYVSGGCIF